ncbi:MAG: hypothetical protein KGK10_05210 [Rhodospirillales bacterium]|nr:hypothetical protein [Rhodospirillales bacterium]
MFGLRARPQPPPAQAVVLDLSGARLRAALADLEESAAPTGGVERYVTALVLKAALFDELLAGGRVRDLAEQDFLDLCAFVSPVRRRIAASIAREGFANIRRHLVRLLDGAEDVTTADARMEAFVAAFPADREHRWVRDLAAEILHYTAPDHYPLMTRWVWDARVGTGVLRELWYAEDMDTLRIAATDDFATFATLRDELAGFLAGLDITRDVSLRVTLLLAHVYAGYINDRGGHYLKNEFSRPADPMAHTRRLLGLDAIDTRTGRARLKLIDGEAREVAEPLRLGAQESRHADS